MNGLEGTVNPAYDKQEDVIKDIQLYLSEAITLLSKAEAENAILPSNDDLIFTGNIDAWKATASVLKARYYNRLSKRDAGGSADNALTALADAYAAGFTSNAANCNANFGTNSNEYNQWYAYTQVDRRGYIRMGSMVTDTLNAMNDPRLDFYALPDDSGNYSGSDVDEGNTTVSDIGNYLAKQNANDPIVPRRLPTVLDERLYNSKSPKITDIRMSVWWDN